MINGASLKECFKSQMKSCLARYTVFISNFYFKDSFKHLFILLLTQFIYIFFISCCHSLKRNWARVNI